MAKRSSFFLAVLLIANPFMLLFYQNCSIAPNSHAYQDDQYKQQPPIKQAKYPASEAKADVPQKKY